MRCIQCGNDNKANITYCTNCGHQLTGPKIDYLDLNKKYFVQTIFLFFCIVILVLFSLKRVMHFSLITHEFVFHGALLFFVIFFLIFDYKNFFRLFKIRPKLKPFVFVLILAPIVAFAVIHIATFLDEQFQLDHTKYYQTYKYTNNVYISGILFVAILPGFLEEMLFRGILFNNLLRLTRPKTVIAITGILFAFVHFSFLSVWLFLIGLILGYLRFRYRTIWYSILFHCVYNASVFFLEIYI